MSGAAQEVPRRRFFLRGPRALIVGLFAVLLLIAVVAVPTLLITVRTLDRQQHRFDPTSAATNDILTGALNEETGLRGYVITTSTTFLEPFNSGTTQVATALATLHGPHVDRHLSADVNAVDTALARWRTGYADRVLADVSAGKVAEAGSFVRTGTGRKLFDHFRVVLDVLRTAVQHDVAANRQRLRHDVELSLTGLVAALAAGFVVATGLWLWWRVWGKRETERDRELADLAVLFNAVLESTTEPIFAKDTDGRHLLANRARAAALGRGDPDVDLAGRTVDEFVDSALAARVRAEDETVLRTGEESRSEEVLQQPDGPHVFVTTKNALEDSAGRRIGVVGVSRDVTEERLLQADRERLYQIEHRLAASLQEAMLGNADLDDDRVEVYARYRPAMEELTVGGDWYDVVPLPNDMIGLIVGDAVGRGIDAATAMGQLRSALTALALAGLDPAGALEAVEAFARTIPDAHSATCLYAIVDPAHAEIVYSVAGHMPPLVVADDGRARYLDDQQDPPLAATRIGTPRRVGRHPFPVHSTLVLFTDGLVERRSEPIDAGLDRLAAIASSSVRLPVGELCDALIDGLLADQRQRDDVAVVVARLVKTHTDRLVQRITADASSARLARHEFQDWVAHYELGEKVEGDLALAVGEALANGVEHAYSDAAPGVVEMECIVADGELRVTVRDHGHWREGQVVDTARGRGVFLMRHLVDDVEIDPSANGTTVVLHYRVRAENESR